MHSCSKHEYSKVISFSNMQRSYDRSIDINNNSNKRNCTFWSSRQSLTSTQPRVGVLFRIGARSRNSSSYQEWNCTPFGTRPFSTCVHRAPFPSCGPHKRALAQHCFCRCRLFHIVSFTVHAYYIATVHSQSMWSCEQERSRERSAPSSAKLSSRRGR